MLECTITETRDIEPVVYDWGAVKWFAQGYATLGQIGSSETFCLFRQPRGVRFPLPETPNPAIVAHNHPKSEPVGFKERKTVRHPLLTSAIVVALSTFSAQATPLPPSTAVLTELAVLPIVPAANGCGYGYRRTVWYDQWGRWHWGQCISKMHRNLSRENMAN